ncbi:MAG: class I adenylate-forming enzyme family protein [Clostridia bacterium]|nr:class I adenylate-forming enzyme family protein [Clostridia bacterium]
MNPPSVRKNAYAYIADCNRGKMSAQALDFYGRKFSYQKLFGLIELCSNGLSELGVGRNSVVTLCLPNIPQHIIAFYAVNRLNAICNIIHPLTPVETVKEDMKKLGSKYLIASDTVLGHSRCTDITVIYCKVNAMMGAFKKAAYRFMDKSHFKAYRNYIDFLSLLSKKHKSYKFVETDEYDHPCCYLHSGGTTGQPKTIVIGNGALNSLADNVSWYLCDFDRSAFSVYSVLPMFHGFGLGINIHTTLSVGSKQYLIAKFNPNEAVKMVADKKVNMINGVPSLFRSLLSCKAYRKGSLSNLKLCFMGGDTFTKEFVDKFNAEVTGSSDKRVLYVGYGLTEVIAICAMNNPFHYKDGSCGTAPEGFYVETFADGKMLERGMNGEICVSGATLMLEYKDDKKATDEVIFEYDGKRWLRTGDYGYVDKDGFLFFIQRMKHIIVRKGVNIFPSEVEAVINQLDFVKKSCVMGVDTVNQTQKVRAYVQLNENLELTDEIKDYYTHTICESVKKKLVRYAVPEEIVYVDGFPRTKVGKIDTIALSKIECKVFNVGR